MLNKKEIEISKALAKILRHNDDKNPLFIDQEGYVSVNDLLKHSYFKGVKLQTIEKIVDNCPKQRYSMIQDKKKLFIRANQGHSIESVQIKMDKILIDDLKKYENVFHCTYKKCLESIKKNGISKMQRNHIHFRTCLDNLDYNYQVAIKIDIEKSNQRWYRILFVRKQCNFIMW